MRHDEEHRIGNYTAGDVALFKDIAEAAADSAVQKMFVAMGHDPKNPLAAQQDAAWTRRMRGYAEGVVGKVILTLVGLSTVGAVHAVWRGVTGALPR